jgi:hypothetical protein
MTGFPELLDEFLADFEPKADAAIETACEQALQTGFMGVRVFRWMERRDDGTQVMICEAQATPEVPYGIIETYYDETPGGLSTTSPMGVRS